MMPLATQQLPLQSRSSHDPFSPLPYPSSPPVPQVASIFYTGKTKISEEEIEQIRDSCDGTIFIHMRRPDWAKVMANHMITFENACATNLATRKNLATHKDYESVEEIDAQARGSWCGCALLAGVETAPPMLPCLVPLLTCSCTSSQRCSLAAAQPVLRRLDQDSRRSLGGRTQVGHRLAGRAL